MNDYLSTFFKQPTRQNLAVLIIACTLTVIGMPQVSDASSSKYELHNDGRLSWLAEDGATITTIAIEIAETPAQRAQGLKERPVPDFSIGMLFVYKNTDMRTFIMTDTPTSLDIIFIDENSRVINIHRQTRPMSDITYSSAGPARFVVEVRAGFCDRYVIHPGNRILWQRD